MTNFVFLVYAFVNSVFVCLFFLSNSQALPCQFSQIQVVHLCKCACVCARARMFLHRWGLPLTEGKACCFVKRMVFFNCAGNPRLKTGDAVAKVR